MADAVEVQVFVDWHYQQCVKALQKIALLADPGSDEHKREFSRYYAMDDKPSGWRVAESMREIANDLVGNVPLEVKHAEELEVEAANFVSGIDSGFNEMVRLMRENRTLAAMLEQLRIYKDAMDSMAAQMIHPKMTGLEMAKIQLGIKE